MADQDLDFSLGDYIEFLAAAILPENKIPRLIGELLAQVCNQFQLGRGQLEENVALFKKVNLWIHFYFTMIRQ